MKNLGSRLFNTNVQPFYNLQQINAPQLKTFDHQIIHNFKYTSDDHMLNIWTVEHQSFSFIKMHNCAANIDSPYRSPTDP